MTLVQTGKNLHYKKMGDLKVRGMLSQAVLAYKGSHPVPTKVSLSC